MLQFFNASGEILYDSVDSILRQFVILQPQFLVDIMEAIVALPDPNTLGKLSWSAELLKESGILDCRLAKELITHCVPLVSDETHLDIVLAMLEAKDLICKVTCQLADASNSLKRHEDKIKEGVYVVPSMLHKGQPFPSVSIDWDIKYYLDFGAVLPDAFLFRLMARCSSHSELVSQSEDQCVLFREGGLFTLGTQFFFMLRKQQPCPTQELVEVSVKAVPESNPIDVLRYLHNIMETLRCRDFPRLQYHVGIMCPHPAPHSSCRTPEMWHIVHLCGNDDTSFPEEPRVRRLCQGRNIDVDIDASIPVNPRYTQEKPMVVNIEGNNNYVVIAGRNARVSVNRESKRPSDHNEGNVYEIIPDSGEIDVYISSSPRDEGWVQEHLVRYLTAPPHKLQVCTNLFDTPSRQNHVINMNEIATCRVFLVVCSRNYRTDPTGRLRYEREVARQRKIPLVAVAIDNTEPPGDMFDCEIISFSHVSGEMSSDVLISKVQKILDVYSDLGLSTDLKSDCQSSDDFSCSAAQRDPVNCQT